MARKLASALMVALMGVPPSTMALGLGELDSDSALNEPLSARIPLLSIRDDEAASIRVSLASPAAFERAGLDRPFYLSQLKFEIKQANGGRYILVSTEKPLKEPFLDFLLEVRSPRGELQREYTVLLDPSHYSGKPADPVQSGRVIASQAWPRSSASPALAHASMAAAVVGERGNGAGGTTRYGPVQANQTLWSIASEVRPSDGVSVYQTMQAILLGNPGAFIDGNINAIMQGAVLLVPPRNEIARLDADEATRQMQAQLTRWQRKHSSGGSETPPVQASAQNTAMGQDKDGTAAAAPALTSPAKGGLHVVAARGAAAAQATASLAEQALAPTQRNILRLQQQLALVAEHNVSLKSANVRLQQQTSSLKKELIDLKSIANLQLDEGARLPVIEPVANRASGSSTAQQGVAIDPRSEVALASSSEMMPATSQLETAKSGQIEQGDAKNAAASVEEAAQSAPITAVAPAADTGAVIAPKTEVQSKLAESPVGASVQKVQSSVAAANPQAKAATLPQANPSLKTRLLAYLPQDAKWLALLVSSLLLILLLLWTVRRRRGAAALQRALTPEGVTPIMGQAPASVTLDKAAPNSDRGADVQPQTDTAVDESTPLGEAEAYIAYGHYDQAQELLDRALGEHPDSQELRLKLLEVLAAQGDRGGFEAEAQVLHTQVVDESDSHWQRAIQLARHIAPDHPLFSKAITPDAETTAVQPQKSVNTAAAVAAEATTTPIPQAMEAELDLGSGKLALDLPTSLGKADRHLADRHEASTILEFDLGEVEAFVAQQTKENAAPVSSGGSSADEDDLESLDFSLPEDRTVTSENRKGNGRGDDQDALQLSELSLQGGGFALEGIAAGETDDPVSLDEVGTKLDLARAYLDMGDAAGARSLLNEVVTEGNAAQQGEAQDMLRQVG